MIEAKSRRITSLHIEWVNGCDSCCTDENYWELKVYRNRGTQSYITKDGDKNILREEKYGLYDFQREMIFTLLKEIDRHCPWAEDYSVPVDDGFAYSVKLMYSDRHVKKVIGTYCVSAHVGRTVISASHDAGDASWWSA